MRGNLSVDILKGKLPNPKVLLVDGNADTIRAIAQGRADALVENVDFFLSFTKNYPNVKWRVLSDPIFVAYCGIGVRKNNEALREFLNVLLYDLHSSGTHQQHVEEAVRRADGRAGRRRSILLKPLAPAAHVDGIHVSIRRCLRAASLPAGRRARIPADRIPVVLGRDRHRHRGCDGARLWQSICAACHRRLCHVLHEHAGTGTDLPSLLRAP